MGSGRRETISAAACRCRSRQAAEPENSRTENRRSLHRLEDGRVGGMLQRAEEVQEILLLDAIQVVEVVDDGVGLGGRDATGRGAPVRGDRGEQVVRPPVMKEEDALAEAPER